LDLGQLPPGSSDTIILCARQLTIVQKLDK
jgi:hypothetical protein